MPLLEVLLVLGAILVLAQDVKFVHSTGAVGRGTSSIVWLIIRYRAEAMNSIQIMRYTYSTKHTLELNRLVCQSGHWSLSRSF